MSRSPRHTKIERIGKDIEDGFVIDYIPTSLTEFFELIVSDDEPIYPYVAKSVRHERWSALVFPVIYRVQRPDHSEFISERYAQIDPIPYLEANLNSDPRWLAAPDWDRVVRKNLNAITRNDFSLINFLLEMDDLVDMCRLAKRIWQRAKPSGLPSLLSDWDELWLQTTFGAIPLSSDLQALWEQMFSKFLKLKDLSDKLKRGVNCSTTRGKEGLQLTAVAENQQLIASSYPGKVIFSNNLVMRWSCQAYGWIEDSRVRPLLDLIGLYPDMSTLWNALPFSFLIDYFIPIGDALESQTKPWTQSTIYLRNACRSAKFTGSYQVYAERFVHPSGSEYIPNPDQYATGDYTFYYRIAHPDAGLDGIDVGYKPDTPSPLQMMNINALAYGMLKNQNEIHWPKWWDKKIGNDYRVKRKVPFGKWYF